MLCESIAEIKELSLFFDLSYALWILKNWGRTKEICALVLALSIEKQV